MWRRRFRLFACVTLAAITMLTQATSYLLVADETSEIAQIIAELKAEDSEVRQQALMAIRVEYGPRANAAVPTLIEFLKSDSPTVGHLQIRKALAAIGPSAGAALIELLDSPQAVLRERAAQSLWHMSLGPHKPQSSVPALVEATRDAEVSVRYWSIRAIGNIGAESNDVVPAIVDRLQDEDATVRDTAAKALASIGPAAKSAVPRLAELLRHDSVSARASAVFALGRIGPNAQAATGQLIQLLADELVMEEAAVALGRIGGSEQQVPALITMLRHESLRSRQLAALTLARIGPTAEAAIDALIMSLDEDAMCEFAIHALGRIGPKSRAAVPELVKLLANHSYSIRAGAAETLGRIGPEASSAIPALKTACHDTNALTRRHAEEAIRKIMKQE